MAKTQVRNPLSGEVEHEDGGSGASLNGTLTPELARAVEMAIGALRAADVYWSSSGYCTEGTSKDDGWRFCEVHVVPWPCPAVRVSDALRALGVPSESGGEA